MKRFSHFQIIWMAFLSVIILMISGIGFSEEGEVRKELAPLKLLWKVGEIDGRCLEFYLSPTEFEEYKDDPLYIVKYSKPGEDWVYIHPGPRDEWAGSLPHPFSILFYLERVNPVGEGKLVLSILEMSKRFPPYATVYINGVAFPLRLPLGNGTDEFLSTFDGISTSPRRVEIVFPSAILKPGENVVQITITSGGWMIYDGIECWVSDEFVLAPIQKSILRIGEPKPLPLVEEEDSVLKRTIVIPVRCYGEPVVGKLSITDNEPIDVSINSGWNTVIYKAKEVSQDKFASVEIKKGDRVISTRDFVFSPAKDFTLYLVPHSHNDIGYTHIQTEVEKIQHENIKKAIELIEATNDYPEEARFCWSAEVLWSFKSFWNKADEETRKKLIEFIKSSRFELPALFANQLTGLCNGEELIHLLDEACKLSREIGITIDTALITDVPGYTWGLIPVLAQNGVKYFYCAPNLGWRIGDIRERLGDKPFYWESQCGGYRVLTLVGFAGYSWFFGGLEHFNDRLVDYLSSLIERNYPYDMAISRYCIRSDNGPPDDKLSDFVVEWNRTHKTPKLVISTASKALKSFEDKYGKDLPSLSGEITPYWEDGSASSARETTLNRRTTRQLMTTETLWALWFPEQYPAGKFAEAWENVILYDEHTWGAHNSITEPDSPFVKQQWEIKQSFAIKASDVVNEVMQEFARKVRQSSGKNSGYQFVVFNPSPFIRADLVYLGPEGDIKGDKVVRRDGKPMPSQRLSSGELAVFVDEVPGWSYQVFSVEEGEPVGPQAPVIVSESSIENEFIKVIVNPETGTIESIFDKRLQREFVKSTADTRMNEYVYVEGRMPDNLHRAGGFKLKIKEKGPLVGTIEVESESVPGAKSLKSEITLIAGKDLVLVKNYIDKIAVRTPESVHYSFSIDVPNPSFRYQTPFAIVKLPEHQLAGSCKNYFTVQGWIDVSNDEVGLTVYTPDAPMVEIGKITVDPVAVGWKKSIVFEPIIFSYVMNNYWETNYKAFQEGMHEFRYYLYPHSKIDVKNIEVMSMCIDRPLVALWCNGEIRLTSRGLKVSPEWCVYHLKYLSDEGAYLLRFFNPSEKEAKLEISLESSTGLKGEVIGGSLKIVEKSKSHIVGTLRPYEVGSLILK